MPWTGPRGGDTIRGPARPVMEDPAMPALPRIQDLIGNTPLVQVTSFDTGPCELFIKLENCNPGGSIKDRIGRSMIDAAEQQGKITAGSTLIEATAGNTGLGLALIAAQRRY